MNKYLLYTRRIGGAAVIVLVVAWLFQPLSRAIFSEEINNSVLVQSIPFVGTFVAIILGFALLIAFVVVAFNGKIPNRAYRPIEWTLIIGILTGVVCLFQPWHVIAYQFGFSLLLFSTLAFILWSHVIPKSMRLDAQLPPIAMRDNIIGVVGGLLVVALLAGALIATNRPQEPYGLRARVWEFMDEDQKAEVITEATSDFRQVRVPFFVFVSLFPGAVVFFASREAAALSKESAPAPATAMASSSA